MGGGGREMLLRSQSVIWTEGLLSFPACLNQTGCFVDEWWEVCGWWAEVIYLCWMEGVSDWCVHACFSCIFTLLLWTLRSCLFWIIFNLPVLPVLLPRFIILSFLSVCSFCSFFSWKGWGGGGYERWDGWMVWYALGMNEETWSEGVYVCLFSFCMLVVLGRLDVWMKCMHAAWISNETVKSCEDG